jgi:hypothetical protein
MACRVDVDPGLRKGLDMVVQMTVALLGVAMGASEPQIPVVGNRGT